MSSDLPQRMGRPPLGERSGEPFIDRGLPLPDGYPGRRVRAVIVEPELLRVVWELPEEHVDHWSVVATAGDGPDVLAALDVPPLSRDCWVRVPAASRGRVRLEAVHGGERKVLASLPFATPADGPSGDTSETWARLGPHGLVVGVDRPEGGIAGLAGLERSPYASSGVLATRRKTEE